jgi:IS66 C-terminal element
MSETRHYDPGSDQGAENWACIASLIETCKLCGVEPQAYLTVLISAIRAAGPAARARCHSRRAFACLPNFGTLP